MYFFTSDEHYGHANIIKHCNRPFGSVEHMNEVLIARQNEKVGKNDIVVHAGDFCWSKTHKEAQEKYISRLNGNHIFIKGSHDKWLPSSAKCRWRKTIEGKFITVDHYAGRTWERAFHKSWQLYGHWHNSNKRNIGLQHNLCVDANNFYPLSFEEIREIMEAKESYLNSWIGGIDTWLLKKMRIL